MGHSKPNVETSNLHLSASDSQFLDNSHALSLPSEPPDLKNWFSSYEYESPALESIGNFGEPVLEESEIAKDKSVKNVGAKESLGGFREISKQEKVLVGEKLNSNGFVDCSSSFGDSEGENQSLDKDRDCSYSSLPLSEPTDIRNWFSSYVYESPELDTNDGFMDSVYMESKSKKDEFVVEYSNKDKTEELEEFKRSGINDQKVLGKMRISELQNHDDSYGEYKLKKLGCIKAGSRFGVEIENPFDQNEIHIGSTFNQCSKQLAPQNQGTDPANDGKLPSMDEEAFNSMLDTSNKIGSYSKASKDSTSRMECIQENPQVNCKTQAASSLSHEGGSKPVQYKSASVRMSTHGCNGKENTGKEMSKDGFVTTRKERHCIADSENCLKVVKEKRDRITMASAGENDPQVKRKVLSERTNMQFSSAVETIGKWQCPQRNKPVLGPPLKQLRLERWVHRL